MKKIPICFCTDDNYALPTSVALTSLIQNKNPETIYDIYVIINDVSETKQKALKACEQKGAFITLIPAPKRNLKKTDKNDPRISITALLRFELPDMLPQYDKILYLDGDILVLGDISELYETELDKEYIAAVRDYPGEQLSLNKIIGVKYYFNSGVLLINAKKWRSENIKEKLYDIWKRHDYFTYMDQDVMNFAFRENVKWISPKYNLMTSVLENQINIEWEGRLYCRGICKKDTLILHMVGEKKPWNNRDAYGFRLWQSYFKKSPMRDFSLPLPPRHIIKDFFCHRIIRGNKKYVYYFGIPFMTVEYYPPWKKKYILGIKFKKRKLNKIFPSDFQADLKTLHADTFGQYKNSLHGKDVVLVATGPSLKNFIPLKDVVYVGVNKAFTYDKIKLDYSFVQDYTIGEITLDQLEKYAGQNGTKLFYGDIVGIAHIPEECAKRAGAKRYYTDSFREPNFKLAHQIDQEPLGDFNSIVFSAMQFILWCHPKRVYIVGCDCSLGGYFNSKEKNSFCVPATEMVKRWENLRDFAKEFYSDVEIISINPVGLKGVFKDLYQNEEKQK